MKRILTISLAALLAAAGAARAQDGALDPIYLHSAVGNEAAPDPAGDAPAPAPPTAAGGAEEKPPEHIEVDAANHRITVDGEFTGTLGEIDLGACAAGGRAWMASVELKVRPSRIVDAMHTLGIDPGEVPVADRAKGTATEPTGAKVNLFLQWHVKVRNELVLRRARLEECFWNRGSDKLLPEAAWIYAGSKFVRDEDSGSGLLASDVSGSVASVSRLDTSALFYYGGDVTRNGAWSANVNLRPAKGTPCRLIIEPVVDKPIEDSEAPVEKIEVETPAEKPEGETPAEKRGDEAPAEKPDAEPPAAKSEGETSVTPNAATPPEAESATPEAAEAPKEAVEAPKETPAAPKETPPATSPADDLAPWEALQKAAPPTNE